MSALLLLVGLPGQLGCGLFQNEAPVLLTVNGVAVDSSGWLPPDPALTYRAGDPFPVDLVVEDPDRDRVRAWWPWAPAGFHTDPDLMSSTWDVPEWAPDQTTLILLLVDDRGDAQKSSTWWLSLYSEDYAPGDTGRAPDTGAWR